MEWHQDKTLFAKSATQISENKAISINHNDLEMEVDESLLQNIFTISIPLNIYNKHGQILQVFPGSHKSILEEEKLKTIAENSNPNECEVPLNGILITKPLILQSSVMMKQQKQQRLIILKFASEKV